MSKQKGLLITIACAAAIGLITFGAAILQNDGFFMLVADFNEQQLPFTAAAWEGVRSGSSWLWGVDLGASTVTTFSFYNLGSPYFWMTLLFPKEYFPSLVGFLFILKYITAAGTSCVYLRRFCKNESAIIGALIYAFSGFQATNLMFYHFHDVVAFFPLLLIGMEDYLTEQKKSGFILAVFLNCLVNYFFFVQEIVFLILYFLFRSWKEKNFRQGIKSGLGCLLCGVWGVCVAGVLAVPSMLYVLKSRRSEIGTTATSLIFSYDELLHVLKGILLPADTMESLSAVLQNRYNSTSCYLPLFGIALALAYILKKRDWLGKLLILLTVLSLFPMGNGLFALFRGLYQRWWYMWCLMMALATAQVLDKPEEYPVKMSSWIYLCTTALLAGVIWLLAHDENSRVHVYDGEYLRLLILIAAAGGVFLLLPTRIWHHNLVVLGITCAFCAGTTAMPLYAYQDHEWYPENVKTSYYLGLQLQIPDDQYRFDSLDNLLMMTGNTGGWGAFSSTLESESYRFNELLGSHFKSTTQGRAIVYVPELLGAKYVIMEDEPRENMLYSLKANGKTFYISEQEACPIGFAVDQWMREEELISLPWDKRAPALMNAFMANGETAERLMQENVPQMTIEEANSLRPDESIQRTAENAVQNFSRDGHGFSCQTMWNRDRFAYFTVPYDDGWCAKIDGEQAKIINSGGMMVLQVPSGEHRITFIYHTPGFTAGIVISAISFALFLLWLLWKYRHLGQSLR